MTVFCALLEQWQILLKLGTLVCIWHRRRMETEGNAKVVASVWKAKFDQFIVALAVLPWSIWKKRLNSAGLFERNGSI